MHSRALALALLLAFTALAGCTGRSEETVQAGGNVDPPSTSTVTPAARFQVSSLEILRPDGSPGELHEDDPGALIRYVVREPADAPRAESAFVTYILNGRIVDIQQLTLDPGEERTFERTVSDLRATPKLSVEVRAASSTAKSEATALAWPRAGADALAFGPLQVRADFGLLEQDGRILVNLTVVNNGPEVELRDFRVKMLCTLPNGTLRLTNSVRLTPPEVGASSGVDALVDDCGSGMRYGLEFKAATAAGELSGRLLLVPTDWRPSA